MRFNTSVIKATSSSGSCNPSAVIHRGLPLTRVTFIKEVRRQPTDVNICVELTEIFKGDPVKIRWILRLLVLHLDGMLGYNAKSVCILCLFFCFLISQVFLPKLSIISHWKAHFTVLRTHSLPQRRPQRKFVILFRQGDSFSNSSEYSKGVQKSSPACVHSHTWNIIFTLNRRLPHRFWHRFAFHLLSWEPWVWVWLTDHSSLLSTLRYPRDSTNAPGIQFFLDSSSDHKPPSEKTRFLCTMKVQM